MQQCTHDPVMAQQRLILTVETSKNVA